MIAQNGNVLVPETLLQRQAHRPVPLNRKYHTGMTNHGSDSKTLIKIKKQHKECDKRSKSAVVPVKLARLQRKQKEVWTSSEKEEDAIRNTMEA